MPSYTAHDMAPFARDPGYVDAIGQVLSPFVWDEEKRCARCRVFLPSRPGYQGAAYILGTFSIVRKQAQKVFGRCRTRNEILQLLNLLTPTP